MSEVQASVLDFERAVAAKEYEQASDHLLDILSKIDADFGMVDGIVCAYPQQLLAPELQNERDVYFCTRMADAITRLFSDPDFGISEQGAVRYLTFQRWIALIFASSPYINADHILHTFNSTPEAEVFSLHNERGVISKFFILYLPESNIEINLDTLWELNPSLCASLSFALQSPRFIGTDAAFNKRGILLQWFPEKLAQISNLNFVPANISHDVYMHCSYDVAANKHDVKRSLNQVIRRHLLEYGWQDRDVSKIGYRNGKPVMVVLLEHFNGGHSIYRTHSTSMVAAREHFHLIGLGGSAVDEIGRAVFDEFHLLEENSVMDKITTIRNICEENGAAVFYMPSIGMDLTTIFASNTRLAPVQAVALGHPGTTHSEFIEYVIVEDDYVGSEDCFSETLIRLPKDALPYVPSSLSPDRVEYHLRENPETVHIGVASTTMKLNPYFLAACREIRNRAKVEVHFHFALGQSMGITHPYVERFIKSYLGNSATVYRHAPYQNYLATLHYCDMMINPFPFGNTNGIIDMVTLGLVGICKTGSEVHEHIDEGLFKRLGLPEWLIAENVDEYVERAVRLAENHEERLQLRRQIIENNGLQTLFSGDPRPMGQQLLQKVRDWASVNQFELSAPQAAAEDKSAARRKPAAKAEGETKAKTARKPAAKAADKPKAARKPSAKKAAK